MRKISSASPCNACCWVSVQFFSYLLTSLVDFETFVVSEDDRKTHREVYPEIVVYCDVTICGHKKKELTVMCFVTNNRAYDDTNLLLIIYPNGLSCNIQNFNQYTVTYFTILDGLKNFCLINGYLPIISFLFA